MEGARKAYIAAVAAAKEKQDEDSITAAASARLHLQSLVLKANVKSGISWALLKYLYTSFLGIDRFHSVTYCSNAPSREKKKKES